MTAQPASSPSPRPALLATAAAAVAVVLWAYWTTLAEIVARWSNDPQYSHGFLVPLFAAYLLWLRRQGLANKPLRPTAWGFGLLLAGVAVRLSGAFFHYGYLDQISLLPVLGGLVLLIGGWTALAWSWPAVAYLVFMVPLPHTLSLAMSGPMQSFATRVSTFLLQTIGRPALAEGNVILLNEIELGIVEACSGLRMLVVFFALSNAVALLSKKPLWERLFVAASAVPIALAANILRITVTGLVYDLLGNGFGGAFFHDLAGWLMMPLGLALLGLELLVLKKLLPDLPSKPLPSQIDLQRVEVNPVALYQGNTSRRQRRAPAAPPAAPAPQPEGDAVPQS